MLEMAGSCASGSTGSFFMAVHSGGFVSRYTAMWQGLSNLLGRVCSHSLDVFLVIASDGLQKKRGGE